MRFTQKTEKTFSEREKKEIREIIKSGIIVLGMPVEIRNNRAFAWRIGAEPGQRPIEIHSSRITSIRWTESNEKQITVRLWNYTTSSPDRTKRYEYELPIEQFKQAIRNAKLSALGL